MLAAPVDISIEQHMPELYRVADSASTRGQNRFKARTAVALILLIVATVGGIIDQPWASLMSAAAFAAGTVMTTLWMLRRYENQWYDGRAAAESAKSLTFKYAVGGEPYSVPSQNARGEYIDDLGAIAAKLDRANSPVKVSADLPDLEQLDQIRDLGWEQRRVVYQTQRIEDQLAWYTKRAAEHRDAGRLWQRAVIGLNSVGVVGAVLKATDTLHFDLLSLCATLAAAAAAWLSAVDHLRIARAYDFTATELEAVLKRCKAIANAEEWPGFVADAEETMSREHTLWEARRRDRG